MNACLYRGLGLAMCNAKDHSVTADGHWWCETCIHDCRAQRWQASNSLSGNDTLLFVGILFWFSFMMQARTLHMHLELRLQSFPQQTTTQQAAIPFGFSSIVTCIMDPACPDLTTTNPVWLPIRLQVTGNGNGTLPVTCSPMGPQQG